MILIDSGNSTLKTQYCREGNLVASFSTSYQPGWDQCLARWLKELPATSCTFASVLDSTRQKLMDNCLADCFGSSVTRLLSQARSLGVTNGYSHPEQLGVDRWLALIAAARISSGDCIVVDAGSAITLDLLRSDGTHLGGAILPGVNTTLEDFKRVFRHIDFTDSAISQNQHPGCSTEAAIQIEYGLDSIVRLSGLVNRWSGLFDEDAEIILAGGDAARIQKIIEQPSRIVPDLVFQGMKLILQ